MPSEFRVKLRKVAKTSVITIPKQLVEGWHWKTGDIIIISSNGEIRIRKEEKKAKGKS